MFGLWALGLILQFCLALAIRQVAHTNTNQAAVQNAKLCPQYTHITYEGTNEEGEKIQDQIVLEPEEYDVMGGRIVFYKQRDNETKATRYIVGCDWQRKIPIVMALKEPDENGNGGVLSIGRFYTSHEEFTVKLLPGERVEFAHGLLTWDVMRDSVFHFRDGTGLYFKPKNLEKGYREHEEMLENMERNGAKLCTHTVKVHVHGTAHMGPNSTKNVPGIEVQIKPKEYMKIGGLRLMRKYVPGEVGRLSAQYEKLPVVKLKRYWLRCNYDNGWPFLIMHERGGDWDERSFALWNGYERQVSMKDNWRLDFLVDFKIPYEMTNGNVKIKMMGV
eukprot:s1624_g9.t1